MVELRDYQKDAIASIYGYFDRSEGNPLVVLPTGSGKSLVLGGFVKDALEQFPGTRVLVMTHRKELIEQDAAALRSLGVDCGIYSAGLSSKQLRPITVGGVQSLVNVKLPRFDLAIIDEAHLVPQADAGMYRDVIKRLKDENPDLKIVGLTATPYRLSGGMLTRGEEKIFTSVCFDQPVQKLVDKGFLSPLVCPTIQNQIDTSAVPVRGGEFVQKVLEAAADDDDLVMASLDEWESLAKDRHSSLFFCVSVAHAENVVRHLRMRGVTTELVTGETADGDRKRAIEKYKAREVRALVSVDVLTTGFDAPCTDCIAILRPTQSTGLYVQIVGRGMRLYPGKTDCLVLDFGGNIERHGPITHVRPKSQGNGQVAPGTKACMNCLAEIASWRKECPECGCGFPPDPRDIEHEKKAARQAIMAPTVSPYIAVTEVRYSEWAGKPGKPPTLMVDYRSASKSIVREWVCFEHAGFAGEKARRWWKDHGGVWGPGDYPKTIAEAVSRSSELKHVTEVQAKKDGEFARVCGVRYAQPVAPVGGSAVALDDDLPF